MAVHIILKAHMLILKNCEIRNKLFLKSNYSYLSQGQVGVLYNMEILLDLIY